MANPWNNKPWEHHPWKNKSWNGGDSNDETDILGALDSAMKEMQFDSELEQELPNGDRSSLMKGGLYLNFYNSDGTDRLIFEDFLNEAGIGSQDVVCSPKNSTVLK